MVVQAQNQARGGGSRCPFYMASRYPAGTPRAGLKPGPREHRAWLDSALTRPRVPGCHGHIPRANRCKGGGPALCPEAPETRCPNWPVGMTAGSGLHPHAAAQARLARSVQRLPGTWLPRTQAGSHLQPTPPAPQGEGLMSNCPSLRTRLSSRGLFWARGDARPHHLLTSLCFCFLRSLEEAIRPLAGAPRRPDSLMRDDEWSPLAVYAAQAHQQLHKYFVFGLPNVSILSSLLIPSPSAKSFSGS